MYFLTLLVVPGLMALNTLAQTTDSESSDLLGSISTSELPSCVQDCMTNSGWDYTTMEISKYCTIGRHHDLDTEMPYTQYIFDVGQCVRKQCRPGRDAAQYAWNMWMYDVCGWYPFPRHTEPPQLSRRKRDLEAVEPEPSF